MMPRFHFLDQPNPLPSPPSATGALPPAPVRPTPTAHEAPESVAWSSAAIATVDEDLYLPQGYEPKYPYPLLVWLQLPGQPEVDLHAVMNDLSDRNYCGLRLELPSEWLSPTITPESPASNVWTPSPTWLWDDVLRSAILELRNCYHIHSERIYLAGVGPAGIAAVRQLLCRPEWFAGAIALQTQLPTGPVPMPEFQELRGKRLWISHQPELEENRSLKLLDLAGVDVQSARHLSARPYDRKLLVQIDRWLMSGICQPQRA